MDRYNAAVEHTLPHGAPVGQQDCEFPRARAPVGTDDEVCRMSKIPYTTLQNARAILRAPILVLFLLIAPYTLTHPVGAASESSSKKAASHQGWTLDEIGRGLKSAAKNIEEEVPKIGPAIGKAFRQVTGSSKETGTSKEPPHNATKPRN